MRDVSLKDIAKKAGYSVTTVSYALRNHPEIPTETAQKIQKLAREMGYEPNPLTTSLAHQIRTRRKRSNHPLIGFVSSYSSQRYWWNNLSVQRPWYEGVKERCQELGFEFEHFELAKYEMSGKRLSEVMKYRNVCGLIIGPVPLYGMSLNLEWDWFPCIALGYSMGTPAIHRVTLNHFQAVQTILQQLEQKGYRRVGFVISIPQSPRINYQTEAAIHCYHAGLTEKNKVPVLSGTGQTVDLNALLKWYDQYRPDVLVDTYGSGHHYYHALEQAGVRVPEDIAYVTMSWWPTVHGVAGIDQNSHRMAAVAVDTLSQMIYSGQRGIPAMQSIIQTSGTWVEGDTCPVKRTVEI